MHLRSGSIILRSSIAVQRSLQSTAQNIKSRTGRKISAPQLDVEALLSKPTWSVKSLLPTQDQTMENYPVALKQLPHLLRLSALPPPATIEEEADMLNTLASQLHFVKEIQKVDTTGVEPLRALRDETKGAEANDEITLDTLKDALAHEDVVGRHYKRIRRRQEQQPLNDNPAGWRPLDHAQRKVGKYFTVDNASSKV
ncbi:hypothetical protein EJ08DRAFT_162843 [Tothia fuscella]|uniref:Glutamyl-tRNA amidotransferase complex subunit Gta3 domain-containing protein n=1 Tax=Tothia fuscella TaxID=1048955 RepID=A0A9P4NUT1_9PEZI|nr:hypothetical protein EJ08DRAFT_162843 [Tothia fuscella]